MPEVAGQPPRPRWGHCMHYVAKTQKIIVYGGRNDDDTADYESLGSVGAIALIDLKYMVWCRVRTEGLNPPLRYNFASFVYGKILLFNTLQRNSFFITFQSFFYSLNKLNKFFFYLYFTFF